MLIQGRQAFLDGPDPVLRVSHFFLSSSITSGLAFDTNRSLASFSAR
jgi:hypothetical protein